MSITANFAEPVAKVREMLHIFFVPYCGRSARSSVAHGGSTSTCTCEAKWDFGKYLKGNILRFPKVVFC